MRYLIEEWPDVQAFMLEEWFSDETYFDPMKNVWFIPEDRYENYYKSFTKGRK